MSISKCHKSREGFTLIELLIVIIVVAILAASAIPIYRWAMARAYSSEVRALLGAIRSVEQLHYAEDGTWKTLKTPYANDDAFEGDTGIKAQHNKWWHAETLHWTSADLWSEVTKSGSGPWVLANGMASDPLVTAIKDIKIAIDLSNGEFLVSYDAGASTKAE